jgi:uncharacterized surface protein with fasciclin (FAS1) repeats
MPDPRSAKNIVTVATETANLKTLVDALKAAALVDTLQAEGSFTLFAPSDAAFAKLPSGTLDLLLADTEKLAGVLSYHIVPGRLDAADMIKASGSIPATACGLSLKIQTRNNNISVNRAKIVQADLRASNGVIHVIDTVLFPTADQVPTGW